MVERDMTCEYGPLSDRELIDTTGRLASQERGVTAELIAVLSEVDVRRSYLGEGFSSLFTFCTGALHLSEHAAYGRIQAARLVRRFPRALDLLRNGSVNLTTLGLVAPHVNEENSTEVFAAIAHKTKREVEQIVAALAPQPAVPTVIRRVPEPARLSAPMLEPNQPTEAVTVAGRPDAASTTMSDGVMTGMTSKAVPPQRAVVAPLAPERYKLQVTLSKGGHDALRALQDLLRHSIPNADPAEIVERALLELLERVQRDRLAMSARPRSGARPSPARSRYIPADVRRSVWARDQGWCAFIGSAGRCRERRFLEFHHVVPFADGGPTTAENLQLRCRAHNAFEAEEWDLSAPS